MRSAAVAAFPSEAIPAPLAAVLNATVESAIATLPALPPGGGSAAMPPPGPAVVLVSIRLDAMLADCPPYTAIPPPPPGAVEFVTRTPVANSRAPDMTTMAPPYGELGSETAEPLVSVTPERMRMRSALTEKIRLALLPLIVVSRWPAPLIVVVFGIDNA